MKLSHLRYQAEIFTGRLLRHAGEGPPTLTYGIPACVRLTGMSAAADSRLSRRRLEQLCGEGLA